MFYLFSTTNQMLNLICSLALLLIGGSLSEIEIVKVFEGVKNLLTLLSAHPQKFAACNFQSSLSVFVSLRLWAITPSLCRWKSVYVCVCVSHTCFWSFLFLGAFEI